MADPKFLTTHRNAQGYNEDTSPAPWMSDPSWLREDMLYDRAFKGNTWRRVDPPVKPPTTGNYCFILNEIGEGKTAEFWTIMPVAHATEQLVEKKPRKRRAKDVATFSKPARAAKRRK